MVTRGLEIGVEDLQAAHHRLFASQSCAVDASNTRPNASDCWLENWAGVCDTNSAVSAGPGFKRALDGIQKKVEVCEYRVERNCSSTPVASVPTLSFTGSGI